MKRWINWFKELFKRNKSRIHYDSSKLEPIELEIVKEIRSSSIEAVVEKYKLVYKDYGHKFMLKYSQINSHPWKGVMAVRECRGLILRKKDLKPMSLAFIRFFNVQESEADPIDWDKAHIMKKEDGSCVTLYWDDYLNEWCVQTTGTADANVPVGSHNMTFRELFFQTLDDMMVKLEYFDKKHCYAFELCTPYNQVVKAHEHSEVVLLNIRNMENMREHPYSELVTAGMRMYTPAVESYNLDSLEQIQNLLKDMAADEEGFVVWDGKNRVKVKNPAYVLKHKSETNFTQKDIFTIIKQNEQDEFVGVIKRYKELYDEAKAFWDSLIIEGYKLRDVAYEVRRNSETRKDYALSLQKHITPKNDIFSPHCYKIWNEPRKIPFNPEDILCAMDDVKLNKMFNKFR